MKVLLPLLLVSASALFAQDSRTVTEPVMPAACTTLEAKLMRVGNTLASADEAKTDTARIQTAMDTCGKGKAVVLAVKGAANAFVSGPLELREGVTLIVDKGTTLFASLDPALFANAPGSCGILEEKGAGCKPLISAKHVSNTGVMGDGTIDGRGGEKLLGKTVSSWDLAEQARNGAHQQVPRLLVTDYADNFTLYRITLKNSSNFHVVYNHGDGFTVWGLKIDTPKRLARNTDGVDPGNGSKNITITHSFIRTGDDNIAIKGGGAGLTNMTVIHNHFYWGHGMSIGSETDGGVSGIRVSDLSLDGPDNGIRIKSNGSRGGLTKDVKYDDVCVRDSPNPIMLDTGYTAAGTPKGDKPPVMRDITLTNVRLSGGGKLSFNGYDATHRVEATLTNVLLMDPRGSTKPYTFALHHADLHLGPGPVNIQFPTSGPTFEDTTVQGKPSAGQPAPCAEKFVPFPQQ